MNWMKRLLALRYHISTQLYTAFGLTVGLTVAASLIGWVSFLQIGSAQDLVNEESVPEMAAAFSIAQYSSDLVAAAPRLTTAATPEEVESVWQEIATAQEDFGARLGELEQTNPEKAATIGSRAAALESNIGTVRDNTGLIFALRDQAEDRLDDMTALRTELDQALVNEVDDQLFYILTGRTELGELAAPYAVHFSETEFGSYRYLTSLQSHTNIALQQLSSVFSIFDPLLVEAQQERFESSAAGIGRDLAGLNDPELQQRLTPLYERLTALGLDPQNGIFVTLRTRLDLEQAQAGYLELSRQQSGALLTEVDGLVSAAVGAVSDATQSSSQAINTGGYLLVAVSVISIGAAVLISWLYVGPVLLRRISYLSARMRHMAEGHLEEQVQARGQDELAEMAAALEVFRQNSLEALRLNLVEELNQELEGKNTELETVLTELESKNGELEVVLEDLQKAQSQIVMREKLAALGEVTAGVAHEIRNPLNFVKNFSELSEELLVEMREELGGDTPDVSLISDISSDLSENLERIRHHGDRANRIVNDMLQMGRDTGNWQGVDLNTLLVEHTMLAYHSARASDPDFQLTITQDLDDEIGEVQAIPQDLSRTFINIVGNACQATDERRRAMALEGVGFEGYQPTVALQTRSDGENVEIRIRDNGPGIPADVAEKIFNPFFTTKAANQGTGLGLAITSDIIRQHGGNIRVESEPGEYTEMVIVLPKTPPEEVQLAYGAAAANADS